MSKLKAMIVGLFMVGLSNVASAQEINGGVTLAFPSGGSLFGFTGRYEKEFANQFKWMVTPTLMFGSGVTLIVLQGGVKYQLEQTPLYFGAELGPVIGSGSGSSDTRFGFTPTIGYRVDEKWDISLQIFTGVGTALGFRFAYVFSQK